MACFLSLYQVYTSLPCVIHFVNVIWWQCVSWQAYRVNTCTYMYVFIHVHTCMYTWILHVCVHVHTRTHIHTYIVYVLMYGLCWMQYLPTWLNHWTTAALSGRVRSVIPAPVICTIIVHACSCIASHSTQMLYVLVYTCTCNN